jgi:hypothetical protein
MDDVLYDRNNPRGSASRCFRVQHPTYHNETVSCTVISASGHSLAELMYSLNFQI